jgi:hypothetical protein
MQAHFGRCQIQADGELTLILHSQIDPLRIGGSNQRLACPEHQAGIRELV